MAMQELANLKGPRGNGVDNPRIVGDDLRLDEIINGVPKTIVVGSVRGPQGLPGVNALENDEAISTYMTSSSKTSTVLKDRGMPVSVIEFGAVRTNDTDMADSSDAFAAALGPGNRDVNVPAGVYYISRPIVIGPDSSIILDPRAVIKLKPMSRCWMFKTDPTLDNGVIRWSGGMLDGRDADQGEWTLGGTAFDVSKGLVITGATLAVVEDLTVRRMRGHSINHWNNERFVARRLRFDQGIDGSQPSGGRRRDGVTGMSRHVDISNISGYSGDDLVAVVAGATWGERGAAGAINIDSVRITNVRPEGSRQDNSRKAWRAVTIWCKDGRGFGSVTVDDVAGETTLSHVAVLSNNDTPNTFGGYVTSLNVSNLSGTNFSATDFGTFFFVQGVSIKHLHLASLYYRPSPLLALPAVRFHNLSQVTNLVASDVYRDEASGAQPLFEVAGTGQLSTARFSNMSSFGLVLRRATTAVGETRTSGVERGKYVGDIVRAETFSQGNGEDANNLIEAGNYVTVVAAANWPRGAEPQGQQMVVTRVGPRIQQTVMILAGSAGLMYMRASADAGATWTAWAKLI